MRLFNLLTFSLAVLLSVAEGPSLALSEASAQRYNQVFTVCTHNSYWVKRSHQLDLFATGTQERLLDQLLFDQARAIEIDIHKNPKQPGQWRVYHTTKAKNVLFDDFVDCLKQLQQFQSVHPQHEVVTVVLELKGILSDNWDATHQPKDLDSLLERYLGPELFRPSDLLQRCPGAQDLRACVASSPEIWPTIQELRGKFIFLVLGNFHQGPIGHGGRGWVEYGASAHPSAFPMQSDFSHFNGEGNNAEKVDAAKLARAIRQSVFLQVENLGDSAHLGDVREFIAQGGMVRGGTAFSIAEQKARIAQGYHFLQTDYPWWRYERKGYDQPFQPIDSAAFPDAKVFEEPGNFFSYSAVRPTVFEMGVSDTAYNSWETLPSTTRVSPNRDFPNYNRGGGVGCLVARTVEGGSVSVCHAIDENQHFRLKLITHLPEGGGWLIQADSSLFHHGKLGDQIRLSVQNRPAGQVSIVQIYLASEVTRLKDGSLSPHWEPWYCFSSNAPFTQQGVSVQERDVLFAGTRLNHVPLDWGKLSQRAGW